MANSPRGVAGQDGTHRLMAEPVNDPVQGKLSAALEFLHNRGIPGWFNYSLVEAGADVVLFVPVGTATTLAFPGKRWWQKAALGFMVSGCIELGQQL
jgi:hypothetical protein